MYFILRLTQLIVRPDSRLGVLRYKIAPKCLLPGPFGHSGVGGNPGVVGTVRSYNLVFTYPCQPERGVFLDALLRTKEAWIEESYRDGRREVRRWDAVRMKPSSDVIRNIRSRPEFRAGEWQRRGITSVRVSIEAPTNTTVAD